MSRECHSCGTLLEIKTDADLCEALADLKHQVKTGLPLSEMRADFNNHLNFFIKKWNLDQDPHSHASLPAGHVEKT